MPVSWTLESSIFAFSARLLQALESHLVLGDVDAARLLELGRNPVDDRVVDVVAAEVGVAVGREDLHDIVADLQDRDVERAAAEVVDGDDLVLLLVEAVRQGRSRGLVDDALDVEAGDAAGVLGGLALGVVEVRGHRDHRLGDLLTDVVLGRLLQLHQDLRADLLGAYLLAADVERTVAVGGAHGLVGDSLGLLARLLELAADEPLGAVDGVLGVRHGLPLRDLTDEHLALVIPCDDARRDARTLFVHDHLRLAPFHDRDDAVRRPEVDPDNLAHDLVPPSPLAKARSTPPGSRILRAHHADLAPTLRECFHVG